jgi:cytochrome b561
MTAFSGWAATLLFAVGVGIPFFIRATASATASYFTRLRPHYWIGFLIPAVAFLHAWIPMSGGHVRGYDQTGLLVATAALVVMLGQVLLGLALRTARGTIRQSSRRLHFWTMATIAILVVVHIFLNHA